MSPRAGSFSWAGTAFTFGRRLPIIEFVIGWRALLASAVLFVLGGCGGASGSDPESASCPMPQSTFGAPIQVGHHIEIPVTYVCEGAKIAGTLYEPTSGGTYPALIWVHGAGKTQRLVWGDGRFLRPFADAGFAVFSFDKRGVGKSDGVCCPGDHGHFNLATADVVGAVAAVRSRPEIDGAHIGLIGASQAGWIAPRAAVDSGHVAFVVLAAPGIVTFNQEHAYEQLTGGNRSDKPFPSEAEIAATLAEKGPSGFDVVPYLRRMKVPALWLLGGRDQEIPLAASLGILKQLKAAGKDYTIHVYPDANHGLFDVPSTDPRAMPDTLEWLRQHT
jgi:pimeloyl-ACP methyl ester carboxylesterase